MPGTMGPRSATHTTLFSSVEKVHNMVSICRPTKTTKTIKLYNVGSITICPSGNKRGVLYCFSLVSSYDLHCQRCTPLPMQNLDVEHVHIITTKTIHGCILFIHNDNTPIPTAQGDQDRNSINDTSTGVENSTDDDSNSSDDEGQSSIDFDSSINHDASLTNDKNDNNRVNPKTNSVTSTDTPHVERVDVGIKGVCNDSARCKGVTVNTIDDNDDNTLDSSQ